LKNKYVLLKLISIIFIYQNCGIIAIYLIGASLNVSVPLVYYFIFCPLISIISLLPVSIAGIGVREGGFVYFFTRVGASKPEALSIALLLFFEAICMALIGGILYWAAGASSAGMATHKQNSLAMPEK
jgi:uncharacterized membrane protein YbhN (UPF0104 family)